GDAAAVMEQPIVVGIAQRREAQKRRIVTERDRELRLGDRLGRRPADTGNHDGARLPGASAAVAASRRAARRPNRELEDRLEQSNACVAYGELGRVDADRNAS